MRGWPCGTWSSGTRDGARRRPRLAALDGAGGELLVVAGPSGVGKTTLLRALAGTLDDAASAVGEVDVRGRLVVLGQHPQLPHAATVGEALGDGSPALLRRLGLDLDPAAPLAEAGRSLSSGQRRRLALARVLGEAAADPAGTVVLLDEPTAHLDAASEQAVVAELRALAGAGALVLAVAHRDALRHAADRVVDLAPALAAANGALAASGAANGALAASRDGARRPRDANEAFAAPGRRRARPFAATTRAAGCRAPSRSGPGRRWRAWR